METSLYLPVKTFLETAGYTVKGEVGSCDLVGLSEGEPPVVVVCELKLSFNLELILQAVDRAAAADAIWIAARVSGKGRGREADRRFRDLCRRLGIGMLGVSDGARSASSSARFHRCRAPTPNAAPASLPSTASAVATRCSAAAARRPS